MHNHSTENAVWGLIFVINLSSKQGENVIAGNRNANEKIQMEQIEERKGRWKTGRKCSEINASSFMSENQQIQSSINKSRKENVANNLKFIIMSIRTTKGQKLVVTGSRFFCKPKTALKESIS